MLKIENLHAFYGKSHVPHGVNFEVEAGEIVALLGRNGSGRSTTAKAIMGLVDCEGGVLWKGQDIQGRKTFEIAHLGLGYVPIPVRSGWRCDAVLSRRQGFVPPATSLHCIAALSFYN